MLHRARPQRRLQTQFGLAPCSGCISGKPYSGLGNGLSSRIRCNWRIRSLVGQRLQIAGDDVGCIQDLSVFASHQPDERARHLRALAAVDVVGVVGIPVSCIGIDCLRIEGLAAHADVRHPESGRPVRVEVHREAAEAEQPPARPVRRVRVQGPIGGILELPLEPPALDPDDADLRTDRDEVVEVLELDRSRPDHAFHSETRAWPLHPLSR